jgi:hypothetical protein
MLSSEEGTSIEDCTAYILPDPKNATMVGVCNKLPAVAQVNDFDIIGLS